MLHSEYFSEHILTNLSFNGLADMGEEILAPVSTDKGSTDWSVPSNKGDFFESTLTANEVCELVEAIDCDDLCIMTSSEYFVMLTLEGKT